MLLNFKLLLCSVSNCVSLVIYTKMKSVSSYIDTDEKALGKVCFRILGLGGGWGG